jgi:hypothetical protein
MAKTSGLGDNLYVGGYDLSGDIQAVDTIHGGPAALDFTDITLSAMARQGGVRDGGISATTFFNAATSRAHPVIGALPTADVGVMYCRGTTLGNGAACCVGKQIGYDPTRDDAGNLTLKTEVQSNGYGLEWGRLLTAGIRTDTAATNGSSIDTLASAAFGGQAYLQLFAFSGTDVTIKIQDSANDSTFADVTGLAFTQVTTGTRQTQRIAIANTATLRRYVRVATITTGGVTSVSFAVVINKNSSAGVTF